VDSEICKIIPKSQWEQEKIAPIILDPTEPLSSYNCRDPNTPPIKGAVKRGRKPGPVKNALNKKRQLKWRKRYLGLMGYIPKDLVMKLIKKGGLYNGKLVALNIAYLTSKYAINAVKARNQDFQEWCKMKSPCIPPYVGHKSPWFYDCYPPVLFPIMGFNEAGGGFFLPTYRTRLLEMLGTS